MPAQSMSVRPMAVAGMFYPGGVGELSRSVDAWLNAGAAKARAANREPVQAVITLLPHAGHVYCGRIIGETLARVQLPKRLILLGPNHTGKGAPLSVWSTGAWQTPFGNVRVDEQLAEALVKTGSGYVADKEAHREEHSLEVVLPFLQRWVPGLSIVPVALSTHLEKLSAAGGALAQVLQECERDEEPAALIVSSDMHHFGTEEETLRLDARAIAALLELDPGLAHNAIVQNRISMCGIQPATLALFAGERCGVKQGELVAHTTSAEVSGDVTRVVGYAGMFFA